MAWSKLLAKFMTIDCDFFFNITLFVLFKAISDLKKLKRLSASNIFERGYWWIPLTKITLKAIVETYTK